MENKEENGAFDWDPLYHQQLITEKNKVTVQEHTKPYLDGHNCK